MTRLLGPATIIPPDLYVERSADRQLREVITGMGRPGYVLVARQMGKTNLLINARRRLERRDLRFVYVDLSARVQSLGHYYGLVLGTLLNVHPDIAELLGNAIPSELSTDEFERTLRSILAVYDGKLVLVLDEIDSLANYNFSDQIFSQIRSMYFARSNYETYNRVTYILSGVAEPADLIKDKNVSPFNIGEKIYLDDFDLSEFGLFLEKANLNFNPETVREIFTWAGGNPRLTWDICSELEIGARAGQTISPAFVESVVRDLYLTSFDRAPVDHIRTIAQSDRDIRRSIAQIRSGGGAEISDKSRSKLYLAGIINMQSAVSAGGNISLKNRIIGETLSERWLADIEKESRGLLQLARENYEENRFEPAISYFEEYLSASEANLVGIDQYRLAISYFNTRRYQKAVEWFNLYLSSHVDSNEVRASVNYMLGRAHVVLGNLQDAVSALREAIEFGPKSSSLPMVRGLLASTMLQLDSKLHADEARSLCEIGLAESDAMLGDVVAQRNTRVLCLSSIATLEETQGNKSRAKELLREALSQGSIGYKPYLLQRLINLSTSQGEKDSLLTELAPSIIGLSLAKLEERADSSLLQISLTALVQLRLNERRSEFLSLLEYLEEVGEVQKVERFKTLEAMSNVATQISTDSALIFMRDIVDQFADVPPAQSVVLEAARGLLFRAGDLSYAPLYIDILVNRAGKLDEGDFIVCSLIAVNAVRRSDHNLLLSLDGVVDRLKSEAGRNDRIGFAFLCFGEIQRCRKLERIEEASVAARDLLEVLEADSISDQQVITGEFRTNMENLAKSHLSRHAPRIRAVNMYRGIGRNNWVVVKYVDGRIERQKFKAVQRDLVLEKCVLERVE